MTNSGGDEGWRMTDFRNNKKLYEMYLDRLKLDYEKAKEMNDKITILRKRLQHVNLLLDDVENYVKNLNFLLRVVNIEETNFKKRRLGYLNQSITEALAEIFPNEQFIAKIDCDVVRGKNYAQLILYDRDGNERMPFVQEGKMCQYLISFAAVKGVTTALGSDTMFIDEGFGSLDSESLEQAVRALVKVTESGRLLGIISHVTELKERIDKQIIVKKQKSGGSTVVI